MSAKEKIKTVWETITTNPDVVDGVLQIAATLVGLLVAAIDRRKAPNI